MLNKKSLMVTALVAFIVVGFSSWVSANNDRMEKKDTNRTIIATTTDPACMKSAIQKRDASINTAVGILATSWQSALTARSTELQAAWDLTDLNARRTAIKAAWDKYTKSMREARSTFRSARKTAWRLYRTDAKACNPNKSLRLQDFRENEGTDSVNL